ncbi:hypothetical protein [Schlesneria sp. DSM 10557]|uniref:hypothetical protein n=2 Tax=unclassified Schlesneria TaxID=2762017 RepID=UPI00359F8880
MDGRLAVLGFLVTLMWPATGWSDPLPKPTHTSKTRFRIPFKIDSATLNKIDAREIQLHVSPNQGQTWELAQVLPPSGGKFEHTCSAEGEYWFAVKTVDGQNQLHPPRGTYETGLIVVVDTTNPVLELSLQQIAAGKVQLRWRASDTHLDINSLRIEYLTQESSDWVPLDLAPRARGETAWVVGKTGVVSVRGSIADFAGNVANARTQTDVDAANHPATKARPVPQGKIATSPPNNELAKTLSDEEDLVLASPPSAPVEQEVASNHDDLIPPSPTSAEPPQGYGFSRPRMKAVSARPREPLPRSAPSNQGPFTPAKLGATNATATTPMFVSRTTTTDPSEKRAEPTSQIHRHVNSRRFQLGYKLEDVGPSGIDAIELFITDDNGKTWWNYGEDPDLQSPFDVEVPEDREYGFAIRARSKAGLAIEPPAPDEPPTIVVGIDRTPPRVELLPAQQGHADKANQLLLKWQIVEEHPAEKPVSIYYAANRTGPWELISGWRENNNGEFTWTVGQAVPAQFYLRLLVRDAAGNVAKAETQQPIAMDPVHPTAKLLDIVGPEVSPPQ